MVPEYNPSSHVLQRALEERPLRVGKKALALAVGAQ
jgi:hypothetical protein